MVAMGEATAAGGTGVLVEQAASTVPNIKTTPIIKVFLIFSLSCSKLGLLLFSLKEVHVTNDSGAL
jgi:hypothetical protein